MKKIRIAINVMLVSIMVISVISIIIICPLISDNLDAYSKVVTMPDIDEDTELLMSKALTTNAIKKIVILIFSILSIILSTVTLVLMNKFSVSSENLDKKINL